VVLLRVVVSPAVAAALDLEKGKTGESKQVLAGKAIFSLLRVRQRERIRYKKLKSKK